MFNLAKPLVSILTPMCQQLEKKTITSCVHSNITNCRKLFKSHIPMFNSWVSPNSQDDEILRYINFLSNNTIRSFIVLDKV